MLRPTVPQTLKTDRSSGLTSPGPTLAKASTLTRAFYGVKRTWTRTGPQSLALFGRVNPSDKLLLTFPCTSGPL